MWRARLAPFPGMSSKLGAGAMIGAGTTLAGYFLSGAIYTVYCWGYLWASGDFPIEQIKAALVNPGPINLPWTRACYGGIHMIWWVQVACWAVIGAVGVALA